MAMGQPSPSPMPPAGPGGAPGLPKSPMGGPGGPGGSPMMSPGGGAGNQAAAVQKIKTAIDALVIALAAFPAGSKEMQAVMRSVSALQPLFGKATGQNMVPAGIQAMGRDAAAGKPPMGPPPPGAMGAGAPPPPIPPLDATAE